MANGEPEPGGRAIKIICSAHPPETAVAQTGRRAGRMVPARVAGFLWAGITPCFHASVPGVSLSGGGLQ